MSDINVSVLDQQLQLTSTPTVAAQGVNEDYIVFDFLDNSWSGFSMVALFFAEDNPEAVYQSVVNSAGRALVPWEATQTDGAMYFGLAGVNGNIRYTSELVRYKIVAGLYEGAESVEPTPSVYEQWAAAVSEYAANVADLTGDVAELSERLDIAEALQTDTMSGSKIVTYTSDALTAQYDSALQQYYVEYAVALPAGASVLETAWSRGASDVWQQSDLRTTMSASTATVRHTLEAQSAYTFKIRVTIAYPESADLAELQDIRVGADGTVYASAGAAVRAQAMKLDSTLTEAGKAADAKATGDAIADLKDEINESVFIVGNTHSPIEWEQGSLHPTGGGKINSTGRIRTNAFSKCDIFSIYPSAGYMIELAAYDAENNNAYVGMWQGDTFNKVVKFFSSGIIIRNMPETYLYKIVLKSSEEEEIDPTYYINCNIKKESYVLKTDFDPSIANNAYSMAQSMQEGLLPQLDFSIFNIGSSGNKISSTTVCCSKTAVKFDRDTFIRCVSSEYFYTLRRYSGEEINASNYIDYLGSFYGTYKLKAGTYYVIAIAKRTAETITDVNEYAKQIEVWSPMYLEEMRKYELDRFAPFGNTRRKIYAHKGITLHEPENTVPSFEAAGIGGAWAIETDIQATSDGYLICMHDMTVDRTTTGTGTIANMTFAEIEQLSIKDHPDLKVPTVEQYLEICKTYGCVPCMELKNVASSQEMIAKLLQTITDYGLESTAVILCSTYSIGYVQCINHKIRCIFIIDPTDLETWIPRAQRYFNVSVTMASGTYTVTHEIIKQLHEAGLVVNVGGVNTVEEIKRYFAIGADSVSSDFIATY